MRGNLDCMRTLDRYIFRQLIVPTVGAVVALTAIALISQSLTQFDLVVEHGQSAWTFIKVTLLSLPLLSGLILPIALFVGTLVALTRLQGENEFIACFASGMPLMDAAMPIIRIGIYFTLFSLASNLFLQPLTARVMREELFHIKNDLISTLVKEGDFSTSESGLTIYVQRVEQNGLLRQIYIRMPSSTPGQDRTYAAKEGKIHVVDGASILVMRSGSTQQISGAKVLDHTTFDEYSMDITPFFSSDDYLSLKEGDRYMHELFFPNKNLPGFGGNYERKSGGKLTAEGHSRLVGPLYNLCFVLLAVVAVLGGGYSRNGYTARIAVAAGVAIGARLLGVVMSTIAAEAWILNVLQYLVPLVPILVCYNMIRKRDHSQLHTMAAKNVLRSSLSDLGSPRTRRPA